MNLPNAIKKPTNPLLEFVQSENQVGVVYQMSYNSCIVMTNDLWKAKVRGVPHNCFLLATKMNPDKEEVREMDQEVLLLRVRKPESLPKEDDITKLKIECLQDNRQQQIDDLTANKMQYGALECSILGTFYYKNGNLHLGSDIESYSSAASLDVYRPKGKVLEAIVNYTDPIRKQQSIKAAEKLGLKGEPPSFRLGTVRFTSTERLHRGEKEELVPVRLNIVDFLARRTGVFGMTRTGKSNAIKHLISDVHITALKCGIDIGQLIFDLNGEYANANVQDQGDSEKAESLYDVLKSEVVRYRLAYPKPGMKLLQNNFYSQLAEGHSILCQLIRDNKTSNAADLEVFLGLSFDKPDPLDKPATNRWEVKCAAYKCVLHKAGYKMAHTQVRFHANQKIKDLVNKLLPDPSKPMDPSKGLSIEEAQDWFMTARAHNSSAKENKDKLLSSTGKQWIDEECRALLNLLAQKNDAGSFITGYKLIAQFTAYHNPTASAVIEDVIYNELSDGRIVIIDLSVGDPKQKEKLSKRIAERVFSRNMHTFCNGENPPAIMVYVEEAHNLMGRNEELTTTWPRLTKEGAKYKIGMVYATQELSSINPNILANTENWLVSHINNLEELRKLSYYYDFADFKESLIKAQDVGFDRVKTLSSPFVIPVQIDEFKAENIKKQILN